MYSHDLIEDILRKADIVSVISSYIPVTKKGRNYVAICPFHDDTNPSLSISPEKRIFKCFVCGTGGNAISFIEKYEKIPFDAAVRKLAKLIGYNDPRLEQSFSAPKVDEAIKRLYDCIDDLQAYYSYSLNADTPEAKAARDYLASRQIDDIAIKRYGIGYSPIDGAKTIEYLKARGHSLHSIESIGIAYARESGMTDNNAGRVVFPIFDASSQVVGFSARRIHDDDSAKYVNSPETPIFVKSRLLYNFNKAEGEARRAGYIYLLEGFMDVMAFNRSGIEPSVALMGTALTEDHIRMLSRLKAEVRVCLDGDAPGQTAMMKIARLLRKAKLNCRLVDSHGDLRDPDDIYRSDGPAAVKRLADSLVDPLDFELSYYLHTKKLDTPEERRKAVESFIPHLKSLPPASIEFEDTLAKLAKATSYEPSAIRELVKMARGPSLSNEEAVLTKESISRRLSYGKPALRRLYKAEEMVLAYMMESKEAAEKFEPQIGNFYDKINDLLANSILDYRATHPDEEQIDQAALIAQIEQTMEDSGSQVAGTLSDIALSEADRYQPEFFDECANIIKKEKEKLLERKKAEKMLNSPSTREEKARELSSLAASTRKRWAKEK